VRPSLWRAALGVRERDDVERKEVDGLWKEPASRELFLTIVAAFVAEARALGRQPVIAILPSRRSIEALRDGRDAAGRREILEQCARQACACFDGIGALVEAGATRRPADYFRRGGHTSAAANAVLGARLHDFLRSEGLAAPSLPRSRGAS
jgi:hypothetical protein